MCTHGQPSHGRPVCADGHTRTARDVLCVLTDTQGRPGVLICVLMDSHRRPVCADGHTRTHKDTHEQPQTSSTNVLCVCWRTPTDVLCVLNRQPTWAKITQTVHGKDQRAESKDQRADMCTDGQPRTSYVLCVLADTHRHTRTHTDSHRRPVCADGQPRTSCPTWTKITQTVHGKDQRSESKDQHADMCTDGQPVSHRSPVCADGHRWTHMDRHGHTRTATDILCVLADTHGRPVCTEQTAHSTGRVGVLSRRTNVLICVLMDSHGRPMCADGQTRTHGQPQTSYVC
ncbi:unnamed protein product [Brassica rapa]|uniref:Uncharacterized protein n=1 Tax=Brassica campestris TaxID=3711 RepID=A0A8D9CW70_BRACM|nr:unnamed protein product [Brassica rapa]